MVKKIVNIVLLFVLVLFYKEAIGQYKIIDDEVIFEFDARDYNDYTKEYAILSYKLKEIDLEDVYVAGEFNDWSREDWKMKRTGEFTFELRKKLKNFKSAFSWRFKFVVNGIYWAEPEKDFENITLSDQSKWYKRVYDFNLYTAKPDIQGNAKFYLKGHQNAKKVILTGSFNKWNENAFKMKKFKDGWELTLKLKPDTYEYKFIVDGTWMEDPDNPNKIYNEHHTFNSIIYLDKEVTFTLRGYENASKVSLAGSFNDWNKNACVMSRKEDYWYYKIRLGGGKYHYKFVVDNQWIIDPANPVKEYDGYGNINSVRMVD